jgi:hypothetical protein
MDCSDSEIKDATFQCLIPNKRILHTGVNVFHVGRVAETVAFNPCCLKRIVAIQSFY